MHHTNHRRTLIRTAWTTFVSVEALEQRTKQLKQQTQALEAQSHTLARQARWWRGIACGVIVLCLSGWGLQAGNAVDAVTDHVAALRKT